ncbi:hypothetical protein [Pinibacter aurantiacus]|uniref:Uncharacterized protein n=1 Tax=Pinibacter aurantiacus TaxID=2851599 RepID=A0A9E2S7B9_9BACT|nr:hypothetical protein [Pinibacter aurantiacus]MBV4356069.1 hypothetical protein [Pinibacter aurantiacus]
MSFVKGKNESHWFSICVSADSCLIVLDDEKKLQANRKTAVINDYGIDWCEKSRADVLVVEPNLLSF